MQHLLPAFNTATGFPRGFVNLATGVSSSAGWAGDGRSSVLSELGTVQLELLRLGQLTGNVTYTQVAEGIIHYLHEHYDQVQSPMLHVADIDCTVLCTYMS